MADAVLEVAGVPRADRRQRPKLDRDEQDQEDPQVIRGDGQSEQGEDPADRIREAVTGERVDDPHRDAD